LDVPKRLALKTVLCPLTTGGVARSSQNRWLCTADILVGLRLTNAPKPTGMSALLSPKLPAMVVRCTADILVGLKLTNALKSTGMSALLSPKLPALE